MHRTSLACVRPPGPLPAAGAPVARLHLQHGSVAWMVLFRDGKVHRMLHGSGSAPLILCHISSAILPPSPSGGLCNSFLGSGVIAAYVGAQDRLWVLGD